MILGLLLAILSLTIESSIVHKTPLDDYVFNNDDISYSKWTLLESNTDSLVSKYHLNITTLKWFNDSFSNNSVWKHDLFITVPKNLNYLNPIFYYIDSAEYENSNTSDVNYVSRLSIECKCITVTIRQVPNQPIKFNNDPTGKPKREDEIIAWTMKMYLTDENLKLSNTAYETIPLLFPMKKSAKRGIDLTFNFLKNMNFKFIEKYIPSGKSKRGWTTWLLTALDDRAVASAPIVFDLINWNLNFHDQYMSLGGRYTFALQDYFNQNLTNYIDSLEFYDLRLSIDPFMYLNRYRGKPVMLILSSSDEFMMPGNTKYFWKELSIITRQKSYQKRYSNVTHELKGLKDNYFNDITKFMFFINSVKVASKWPKYVWDFGNNKTHGIITVKLSQLSLFDSFEIVGYDAKGANGLRDFRKMVTELIVQPVFWIKRGTIEERGIKDQLYEYEFSVKRDNGYKAFYVDAILTFKGSDDKFTLSSDVNFVPEYFPISDCTENQCAGHN